MSASSTTDVERDRRGDLAPSVDAPLRGGRASIA